ncbi:MAG TPA: hypothetical protein VEL77_15050 [Rugosimonospora sp.]|nr:hypothetical protein [Rugosimonospora sp.]
MSVVLLFHELAATGERTEYTDRYLVSYDPSHHWANGDYDGGLPVTTPDPRDAIQFADAGAAMEMWKRGPSCRCHRLRPDGEPNRPLTAYTVSVEPVSAVNRGTSGETVEKKRGEPK